jgi:hypothetical protein
MGGAPLGNQNAAGSDYDIEKERKALEAWSKRPDATALCQFCVERDIYAQRMYEWRDENPLFAETLKKAKLRIAVRLRSLLHDKKNPYNYGLFMREIGFHDTFVHDHEEDQKDKDEARKAKALKTEVEGVEEIKRLTNKINENKRKPE